MSGLARRLSSAASDLFGTNAPVSAFVPEGGFAASLNRETAIFTALRALYENSGCYERIGMVGPDLERLGLTARSLKGLRNPTQAATDFYTAVVMPGRLEDALPLAGDPSLLKTIKPAAEQVWAWSNWEAKKQVYVRSAALLGECYLQVATKPDNVLDNGLLPDPERVYLSIVQPEAVRLWGTERDERGFVTRIRLEVPERDPKQISVVHWHVEIWEKATQEVRYYRLNQYPPQLEAEFPEPERVVPFAALGIDFVPFVHVPFRDIGGERGVSPVLLAFDKIMELDQLATSLHQALYRHNKPENIFQSPMAPDGMIAAIPTMDETLELKHDGVNNWFVPPGWTMATQVAAVNYAGQLQAVAEHWQALKDTSLPELNYWALAQTGQAISGRALESRLKGAVSLAIEARGNLESGLVRAMQMAFTIGKAAGLEPFTALGDYYAGQMDFSFAERDVIPMNEEDNLELVQLRATVFQSLTAGGSDVYGAAIVAGFTPEEATALAAADVAIVTPTPLVKDVALDG